MARAAARDHVRASFSQDHDSAGRRAEGKAIGATPPPPLSASCNAAPSAVIIRAYPTKGLCCRGVPHGRAYTRGTASRVPRSARGQSRRAGAPVRTRRCPGASPSAAPPDRCPQGGDDRRAAGHRLVRLPRRRIPHAGVDRRSSGGERGVFGSSELGALGTLADAVGIVMERKHSMLCRTFIAVLSAVATVFLVAGCAELGATSSASAPSAAVAAPASDLVGTWRGDFG